MIADTRGMLRVRVSDNSYKPGIQSFEIIDSNLTTAHPENGTVLTGKNGNTYTIGEKTSFSTREKTVTVLTVYKGKYIALTDSIKEISDNIMGIVNYLDSDQHIPQN